MTNFSIIPLASSLILTVLLFASSSLAVASESGLAWQTNASSVALFSGEKMVRRFNFATNNATKPFFHPLALPDENARNTS